MKQEIEIEFKNLLTKEEYEKLSSEYFNTHTDSYKQRNSYYDTNSFQLKKANCALRIRIKEQDAEITLKSPFKGYHKELNIPLTIEEAERLISAQSISLPEQVSQFLKKITHLDITHVSKVTELTTERIEKNYKDCLLVLDKSWYSDKIDYELEIESPSIEKGQAVFNSILNSHAIPKRETLNKIARAQNALL